MNVYHPDECAIFYRTRGPHGELSNMRRNMPIWHGGVLWESTEALYQACRYPGRSDFQAKINVSDPMEAKKIAYEFIGETRPDWHQAIKIPVMEGALRLKVDQHPVIMRAALRQTHHFHIVEKSRSDDFWGAIEQSDGTLKGENVLGLLWMVMREEIERGVFHANVELPL